MAEFNHVNQVRRVRLVGVYYSAVYFFFTVVVCKGESDKWGLGRGLQVTAFRALLQSRRDGGVVEQAQKALEAAALRTIDEFAA